jgi:hypothetical protein
MVSIFIRLFKHKLVLNVSISTQYSDLCLVCYAPARYEMSLDCFVVNITPCLRDLSVAWYRFDSDKTHLHSISISLTKSNIDRSQICVTTMPLGNMHWSHYSTIDRASLSSKITMLIYEKAQTHWRYKESM